MNKVNCIILNIIFTTIIVIIIYFKWLNNTCIWSGLTVAVLMSFYVSFWVFFAHFRLCFYEEKAHSWPTWRLLWLVNFINLMFYSSMRWVLPSYKKRHLKLNYYNEGMPIHVLTNKDDIIMIISAGWRSFSPTGGANRHFRT